MSYFRMNLIKYSYMPFSNEKLVDVKSRLWDNSKFVKLRTFGGSQSEVYHEAREIGLLRFEDDKEIRNLRRPDGQIYQIVSLGDKEDRIVRSQLGISDRSLFDIFPEYIGFVYVLQIYKRGRSRCGEPKRKLLYRLTFQYKSYLMNPIAQDFSNCLHILGIEQYN